MDNTLARIGALETAVSDIRIQVTAISATMATKDDIATPTAGQSSIKEDVSSLKATIPHLATKADLEKTIGGVRGEVQAVRSDLMAMESKIIRWVVTTTLSAVAVCSGIAFSLAKFVH